MNRFYLLGCLALFVFAAHASAQSPFTVPADTNWVRAGSADDIHASGAVYQCTDTNEPEIQVVFFNRVTPHATRQEHLNFFKDFLHNIQNAYPNAVLTYVPVMGEDVPLVSVFDPEGNTFFWGALYKDSNTYEIAVTAEGRWPALPVQVRDLFGIISISTR